MANTPKILVLFCGGTIAMHQDEKLGALQVGHGIELLLKLEPRISELAELDFEFIDNIDSANMVPNHWERLGERIAARYGEFDGFVITMGTNTLAYASSALTFSLLGIGKPVIFTGAQIPAESMSSDARSNFVNAVRVAAMDIAGVFVVFGSRIILGCRAKKISEAELDAFETFNAKDFGEISVGLKLNSDGCRRHDRPLVLRNGFDTNIVCLTLIPGLGANYLMSLLEHGVHGVIIRAYGSGDIPYNFLSALEYAQREEIPIAVTTQCPGGATIMGLNDCGLMALKKGVIQAFDMSIETISTKMMWLLKQKLTYSEIRSKMNENLAGEIDTLRTRLLLNKELLDQYDIVEKQ